MDRFLYEPIPILTRSHSIIDFASRCKQVSKSRCICWSLLFCLISELRLRGGPYSGQRLHLLPSLNPDHRFSALKRLTIGAQNGELEWPLSTLLYQLQWSSLQTLEYYCTTEWEREVYKDPWQHRPLVIPVPPRSISITRVML